MVKSDKYSCFPDQCPIATKASAHLTSKESPSLIFPDFFRSCEPYDINKIQDVCKIHFRRNCWMPPVIKTKKKGTCCWYCTEFVPLLDVNVDRIRCSYPRFSWEHPGFYFSTFAATIHTPVLNKLRILETLLTSLTVTPGA